MGPFMLMILGAVGTAGATVLALLIAFEALPKERRDWWLARIKPSNAMQPAVDLISSPAPVTLLAPQQDDGAVSEGAVSENAALTKTPKEMIDYIDGVEFDFARTIDEVRQVSSYDTGHYIPDDT